MFFSSLGDMGRTFPNLCSIMNSVTDISQLDVLEVTIT
jgi:tRNA U54 and U55 pseudouridine synthase Pus10